MVLRFNFGSASLLFTGDIEWAGERAMLSNHASLRATILKVPHHGSATYSTAAFIAAVHPQAAVISDGYLNNFHFPYPRSSNVTSKRAQSSCAPTSPAP